MTAYAPSFQNLNWLNWDPDLVAFTANYDETVLSVSYYSQQMFAHHRGTETVPVTTVQGSFNPLRWVATIDDTTNEMCLKVVNSGNSSIPLTINLDTSYTAVNGTILVGFRPDSHSAYYFQSSPKSSLTRPVQTSAHLSDFNYLGNQTAVVPTPIGNLPVISGSTSKFVWNVPAYSVNVIQFDLGAAASAVTTSSVSRTTSVSVGTAQVSQVSYGQPQAPTATTRP
jgi:alpha-N-arabinofuranosidase